MRRQPTREPSPGALLLVVSWFVPPGMTHWGEGAGERATHWLRVVRWVRSGSRQGHRDTDGETTSQMRRHTTSFRGRAQLARQKSRSPLRGGVKRGPCVRVDDRLARRGRRNATAGGLTVKTKLN